MVAVSSSGTGAYADTEIRAALAQETSWRSYISPRDCGGSESSLTVVGGALIHQVKAEAGDTRYDQVPVAGGHSTGTCGGRECDTHPSPNGWLFFFPGLRRRAQS